MVEMTKGQDSMPQEHPIIPPPELIHEWQIKMEYTATRAAREALVTKVFQLGADMELEACCEWVANYCPYFGDYPMPEKKLRAARRPKPSSLKEQALDILQYPKDFWSEDEVNTIRRALEQLNG